MAVILGLAILFLVGLTAKQMLIRFHPAYSLALERLNESRSLQASAGSSFSEPLWVSASTGRYHANFYFTVTGSRKSVDVSVKAKNKANHWIISEISVVTADGLTFHLHN